MDPDETGRHLGWSAERVERVRAAGVLHDIGKLGVPDAILLKPDALDRDEWQSAEPRLRRARSAQPRAVRATRTSVLTT